MPRHTLATAPLAPDQRALVEEYLRQWSVLAVAKRVHAGLYRACRTAGADDETIRQECETAICRGAHRYDPARASFPTFASWYVKSGLTRTLWWARKWGKIPTLSADAGGEYRGDGPDVLTWNGLPDERMVGPADFAEDWAGVVEAMAGLPGRERAVLLARFGLPPADREYSLREIGQFVGLSKERVRQIEERGLAMLRARLGG